nr:hypothetical protein BSM_07240 [uncultured archaeon]
MGSRSRILYTLYPIAGTVGTNPILKKKLVKRKAGEKTAKYYII